jgi:hypothetical protein
VKRGEGHPQKAAVGSGQTEKAATGPWKKTCQAALELFSYQMCLSNEEVRWPALMITVTNHTGQRQSDWGYGRLCGLGRWNEETRKKRWLVPHEGHVNFRRILVTGTKKIRLCVQL